MRLNFIFFVFCLVVCKFFRNFVPFSSCRFKITPQNYELFRISPNFSAKKFALYIIFCYFETKRRENRRKLAKKTKRKETTMENEKSLQERFFDLYVEAMRAGKVTSKSEFAELIGTTKQTVGSAFSGKRISESLVMRAELIVRGGTVSPVMVNTDQATGNTQKNFDTLEEGIKNEDVRTIVHELVENMRAERESHERIVLALLDKMK